jgi:DNA-cytosine methyltransferase
MNVLSLFDGMSCGQIALERAGIKVDNYFASEIDKYGMQVSKNNYPGTIHLGDVTKWREWELPKIDLLIGGSPCQGFSKAGKQLNFDDPRSKLFFEFVNVLNTVKPKYFLLENVRMKKEYQDIITEYLGVEPININSALVSAQRRERLYWTNIPGLSKPDDKGILLEHILESGDVDRDKSYCLDANYFKGTNASQYLCKARRQVVWVIPEATKKGFIEVSEGQCVDLTFIKSKTRRGRLMIEKSNCLTASSFNYCKVTNDWFRKLTPLECERLQTVPEGYTKGVSDSQRYKMLGNGWTVDVIAHIFEGLK